MNSRAGSREESVVGRGAREVRWDFYLEDCVSGMRRRLAPGSVDVVVTSPPYNLGVRYGAYDDTIDRRDYLAWTAEWAAAVKDVMSDYASFFLNVGSKPTDPWVPFEVAGVLRGLFHLQNVIHWVKSIAISKADVGDYGAIASDAAVGHYKPINGQRYLNDCHEYVFHFTKTGTVPLDRLAIGVPYQDKSNVGRWRTARAGVRCRGNTWFIPYETISRRERDRPHPATFPPRLPEMCVRLHGVNRCRLVLDPFLGIGNTAIACVRLGVPFTGFEIDEAYFDEAVRRVKAEAEEAGVGKDGAGAGVTGPEAPG